MSKIFVVEHMLETLFVTDRICSDLEKAKKYAEKMRRAILEADGSYERENIKSILVTESAVDENFVMRMANVRRKLDVATGMWYEY